MTDKKSSPEMPSSVSESSAISRRGFLKGLLVGAGSVASIGSLMAYQALSVVKESGIERAQEIQEQMKPLDRKLDASSQHLKEIRADYEKITSRFSGWKSEMLSQTEDLKEKTKVFTTDAAKKKVLTMLERYAEVKAKSLSDSVANKGGVTGFLGKAASSFLDDAISTKDYEDTLDNDQKLQQQWNDFIASYKEFEKKGTEGVQMLHDVERMGKEVESLGAEGQEIMGDAQKLTKELRDMDLQVQEFKRVLFKNLKG